MFRALYTAATGMQAQQTNLDTIANNLSNSSTAGFQSRRMQFQDLIYQNIVMPGAAASQQTTVATGLQVGLGTRSAASEILQLQGDLSQTGNPLDLAIEGQGLFQVLLPTGQTAYTRSGEFHQDSQGNVVTAAGNPLQPAVAIPAGPRQSRSPTMVPCRLPWPVKAQPSRWEAYSLRCFPIRRTQQRRPESVSSDHRIRRSRHRHTGRQHGLGTNRARISGAIQRQRSR